VEILQKVLGGYFFDSHCRFGQIYTIPVRNRKGPPSRKNGPHGDV